VVGDRREREQCTTYTKSGSEKRVGDLSCVALPQKNGSPKANCCSLSRYRNQSLLVLHSLQTDLLLAHTIAIIIFAVTGWTQTKQDRIGITEIMVAVCCVQVHTIPLSCAFGFPLSALCDMAKLALPTCVFLALPRQIIPIVGIAFPPFGFH